MSIMNEIISAILKTTASNVTINRKGEINNQNFQDIEVKITITNEDGTKETRDLIIKDSNDYKNFSGAFVASPELINQDNKNLDKPFDCASLYYIPIMDRQGILKYTMIEDIAKRMYSEVIKDIPKGKCVSNMILKIIDKHEVQYTLKDLVILYMILVSIKNNYSKIVDTYIVNKYKEFFKEIIMSYILCCSETVRNELISLINYMVEHSEFIFNQIDLNSDEDIPYFIIDFPDKACRDEFISKVIKYFGDDELINITSIFNYSNRNKIGERCSFTMKSFNDCILDTIIKITYNNMKRCVNAINKSIIKYNGLYDVTDMYLYSQAGGDLLNLICFKEPFELNYKIELSIDDKGLLNIELKNR